MEDKYSKVIAVGICMFTASCAFDGESTKVLTEINKDYYVLEHSGYSNDGLMIGYSINGKGSYGIISSNCNDIYYNNDTIMYSRILVQGGDTTYHIISINPKRADGLRNDPIHIKKATFKNHSVRFNKVNLPDKTK